MSVPKQRHTKGRQKRRRGNLKITAKKLVKCSHCSKMTEQHKVCPSCGFYKGKKVVDASRKTKKGKGKKGKAGK